MADQLMDALSFNSSGNNTTMQYIGTQAILSARKRGRPLAAMTNISKDFLNGGDTVRVPIAANATSSLRVDGAAITLDNSSGSSVNVTVNRMRESNFGVTDIASAQNSAQGLAQLQSRITTVLNEAEADVLSSITTGLTTNTAGTYNTDLTEAVIVGALGTLMSQADAPDLNLPLVGLLHPSSHAWGAVSQLAAYQRADGEAQQWRTADPMFQHGDKWWHGVNWRVCNSLPVNGTSTDNCILHPNAIAFAVRPIPLPSGVEAMNVFDAESGLAIQVLKYFDGSRQAEVYVVKCLYGFSIIKENHGILLKS